MTSRNTFRMLATMVFVLCLGVAAIHAQWMPIGPDGGDVRSLEADPQDPSRIFLGTSAGQIYLSTDAGGTWKRLARLGTGNDYVLDNIEVDPVDSKTVFVAAWSVLDQVTSGDLFRSRDGGKTWQPLPGMHGKSIRALAISKSDHRVIIVGALDGIFRSRNGGESWERISPANHLEIKNIESVAIDPHDADTVYAGTWHLAWKTSNGGRDWYPIKKGVIDDSDVFSIIVDGKDSSVVYMSACSGIYKSENAGELFRRIQGIPFSARRTRVLQQDSTDANVIYAGTTEGLWKTVDGGTTWKRMTAPNIIVNDVLVNPRQPARVLIATDRSGVLASSDGALSFVSSNSGFAHRQVSAVVVDRNDPKTIYAGVVNDKEFGGVFVSHDGGDRWLQITDGLAGQDVFTLAQSDDGTLVAGTNRGIYALARGAGAWRPINVVVRTKQVKLPRKSRKAKPVFRTQYSKSRLSARVAKIEVGPDAWFMATSAGLYRSLDRGRTWQGGDVIGHRSFISVQALDRIVLAATSNSVALSRDRGTAWTRLRLPPYVTAVYGIAAEPGTIWLATREGALRSADVGETWEHVLGGLPARQVSAITCDLQTRHLHAATFSGELYESVDGGQSWRRADDGWTVRNLVTAHGQLLAITAFDGLLMMQETPSRDLSVSGGGGTK